MQATENQGEMEYSLCLYRDKKASELEIQAGVLKLMACFRHEKDASFWAVVHQTISDQTPTRQQLKDIISNAMDKDFLNIRDLKYDRRIKMYSYKQALRWYNQNASGNERNHILLYFYAYSKEMTGGEPFYSLWSDIALTGADVASMKKVQAQRYGY